MKWWLKALIGSVILGAVLFAIIMLQGNTPPATEAQDERLSELYGMGFGIALTVVWAWCFLKRGTSEPEEQETALDPSETVLLEARHCGYLKSKAALLMGKGRITNTRFLWNPNQDLIGLLTSLMYRAKFVSIPLSEIQEAAQTSFGANKQVVRIQTAEDREYRFLVDDVNEWLELLNKKA